MNKKQAQIHKAIESLEKLVQEEPETFYSEGYQNEWLTRSLFWETAVYFQRGDVPGTVRAEPFCVFTLKDHHRVDGDQVWLSFKRLAVELLDPTMYLFANTYLAGLAHWKDLQKCKEPRIQKMLKETLEEIELAKHAKAIEGVITGLEEGNVTACKYVLDRRDKASKIGRPTKAEAALKEKQEALIDETLDGYGESIDALERADLN